MVWDECGYKKVFNMVWLVAWKPISIIMILFALEEYSSKENTQLQKMPWGWLNRKEKCLTKLVGLMVHLPNLG